MERVKVQSSAIASVGYDADHAVLEVEYVPKAHDSEGDVWQYAPVAPSVWRMLLQPNVSVGAIVNALVRKNPLTTSHLRIDPVDAL